MRQIVIIAHDIRSTHNVGSLLRTADGLDAKVWLTGYTPYPKKEKDIRLPHLTNKIHNQIKKTALGAEKGKGWSHTENIEDVIQELADDGFEIICLEQHENSIDLPDYKPPGKVAIIIGREVEGISKTIIDQCEKIVEIPMYGDKESYNVVESATMALYHCRFFKS
ncbi:MAG: TrmH family RNA methyltransferase [bacterium]|nr:TrmH family RNA methyltransferase [bacterium]